MMLDGPPDGSQVVRWQGAPGPEQDGYWRATASVAPTASSGSWATTSTRPSRRADAVRPGAGLVADGAPRGPAPRDAGATTAASATAAAGAGARRTAAARAHARARTPDAAGAAHRAADDGGALAVLHAITQLHGKATTQKKVRRAAESALGQPKGADHKKAEIKDVAARRSRA